MQGSCESPLRPAERQVDSTQCNGCALQGCVGRRLVASRASVGRHLSGYIGRPIEVSNYLQDAMKKLPLWSAVILFCGELAVSSVGLAQKTYALGFGGGAAIPVGKLSDTQKTGYNALVAFVVGVADLPFGVRLDGIYNNLSRSEPSGAAVSTFDLRVSAALANLVFALPGSTAKAYIIAGGGLYNSKANVAGAKSQNAFGVNAGLGATFGFGPFGTFLESRYHSVSRSESKGGVYQFVPITVGVLF